MDEARRACGRRKVKDDTRASACQRRLPRFVRVNNRREGDTPLTVQALSEMLRS
jgi:hypothetical protein